MAKCSGDSNASALDLPTEEGGMKQALANLEKYQAPQCHEISFKYQSLASRSAYGVGECSGDVPCMSDTPCTSGIA